MSQEYVKLDAVIDDHVTGPTVPPESTVVAIGSDGNPGNPKFWNRSEFRHLRVTNRRNKAAVARITIPRLLVRDRNGAGGYVDVRYEAWCEPNREETLAAGINRHTRAGRIEHDVNELIEDWLRTELQGKESVFLSALLGGDACASVAERVRNQAAAHLALSISLTFEMSDRAQLKTLSIEPITVEVFPAGFARSRVPVTLRADIRPVAGRELSALASATKAASFKELLNREATRVIETSISLDELNSRPPVKAKEKLTQALDRSLLVEGWQILSLDVVTDWKPVPPELKISEEFSFQLAGLPREWSGKISFLAHPEHQARFFESGIAIESVADWARANARALAVRKLGAQTFQTLLGAYQPTKDDIKASLVSLLAANGYVVGGFNLTTTLPIEALAGIIRTPERQNIEFFTRFPNRKVRMTYYIEYQFPDLARVQRAVLTNDDVPQSVADAVDQALTDQLRATELLDFYFHFDVAEKGGTPIRETLIAAIQKRLDDYFGARIRSSLLIREDDDVLSKIDEMVQPARQGAVQPFDVPHPRLERPVHVRTLVFLVGEFSKKYFYQFVVTKPGIEQIEASVKTHCEQWLADVSPELFFRIPNRKLRSLLAAVVVPCIQEEFGVTISIANFILGRHQDVLPPASAESTLAEELRFWRGMLEELRTLYREQFLGDDAILAASTKDKIDNAQKEIERLTGELRRHEMGARRQIATDTPKGLMSGDADREDDESDDATGTAAG
jgi:hypothetical protein